jgi:hypothetical protein
MSLVACRYKWERIFSFFLLLIPSWQNFTLNHTPSQIVRWKFINILSPTDIFPLSLMCCLIPSRWVTSGPWWQDSLPCHCHGHWTFNFPLVQANTMNRESRMPTSSDLYFIIQSYFCWVEMETQLTPWVLLPWGRAARPTIPTLLLLVSICWC